MSVVRRDDIPETPDGQVHDEFCLDLMYGWHDDDRTFHPAVATEANGFAPHVAYHRRIGRGEL